ncbi:MAG TPA: 1,4-alpha-glucan branching protein domain-containing protein [Solirubrobacteraceae bacterium]|nr:1,4-alpha-glucan branching protein domain-containing protein [Solirubrobacteraceae bacterium]
MPEGELAIVLHTHMPYVEGFGTWPFGEEWLWEAIATSYLPLLEVLDARRRPAPLTLSLTPVLCDQLAAPGAMDRCLRFLRDVRPESHRRDVAELRARGERGLAAELERSAAEYAARAEQLASLERTPGGLLHALGTHAGWTSAATHAVLPLLATERALELQVRTGITSHRRRFGTWEGGFWLPECAHASWLGPPLRRAGVRATCVELTRRLGLGDPRHLEPMAEAGGPVLWPIDRLVISWIWGEGGYPSRPAYRDYHRYTTHRHRAWRIDGAPYDRDAALAQARADAAEFVAGVGERIARGGVCVCALDTELLGHWWYEGPAWLSAVLDEATRQGLRLTTLDAALTRREPRPLPLVARGLPATSWGAGEDLRTWSGPRAARFAWRARRAELRLASRRGRPSQRALRELLALQSSDWAFLHDRDLSGEYPEERAAGHEAAIHGAWAGEPALRALAPWLEGWGLSRPSGTCAARAGSG